MNKNKHLFIYQIERIIKSIRKRIYCNRIEPDKDGDIIIKSQNKIMIAEKSKFELDTKIKIKKNIDLIDRF